MIFLILHGITGHAGKHWMQWLNDELIKLGHTVLMPTLPNTNSPSLDDWRNAINDLIKDVNKSELVIIGHSMGVPAALNVIQDLDSPIKGLISVGGFYRDYGAELNTKYMSTCIIDINKARLNIKNSAVIYGDNDPHVPQNILNELAVGLQVKPYIIKNGGHLNTDAGFTHLPIILDIINEFSN